MNPDQEALPPPVEALPRSVFVVLANFVKVLSTLTVDPRRRTRAAPTAAHGAKHCLVLQRAGVTLEPTIPSG